MAAAEVGIGLAMVLLIYRNRRSARSRRARRHEGLSVKCGSCSTRGSSRSSRPISFVDHPLSASGCPSRAPRSASPRSGRPSSSSCGTAFQWIQQVEDAERGEGLFSAFGRSVIAPPRLPKASLQHRVVAPIIKSVNWFDIGGVKWPIGSSRRPGRADGVSSRSSRCSCTSSRSSTCAATGASPTSTRRSACSPRDAPPWSRREHDPDDPRLGAHGPLLVHADRALVGGVAERRRRPEGLLHHPNR